MPTVSIIGKSATASWGSLRIYSSDWYNFYYEQESIVDANGGALDQISGIESSSSIGEITAFAIDAVNVEIAINGVSATFSTSEISVSVENPEVWSSGKIQRYPANAFKNSSVKLSGIVAHSVQSDVIAFGTVQINATITLDNVVSFTQVANINADGILSISDDELILLMAA